MKQFSNFTFIKQIAPERIGSKFNLSYRLKYLLEKEVGLAKGFYPTTGQNDGKAV
ncbi:MAG: hypothetical protein H6557_14205 [Lewinellaceae bacterium]|nr:hypothetical protein [Phaeodactylibacter sp.]MCB9037764.1 hypothetical protein [Lewinellaceae bacterium]